MKNKARMSRPRASLPRLASSSVLGLWVVYHALISITPPLPTPLLGVVAAQCDTEVIIAASDAAALSRYGWDVGVSGTNAIIGAYNDTNVNGWKSGIVYMLSETSPGNWSQSQIVSASDGARNDVYGFSVGISGTNAIAGAFQDDDVGSNSGSVYIFAESPPSSGSWSEVKKVTASDGAIDDHFGYAVAINGQWAVVGAPYDDDLGSLSGSVYFIYEGAPGNWTESQKLTASDGTPSAEFGTAVSIDGSIAVVGAPGTSNGGTVYVFLESAGWSESDIITASVGAAGDLFGAAVDVSGDNAIIGAHLDDYSSTDSGAVYIFHNVGGNWTELARIKASDAVAGDNYGMSVAISGTNAIVGASGDDDSGTASGSVYVLAEVSPNTWVEVQKITASDGAANDQFGYSVSLTANTTAFVGAPYSNTESGAAYYYSITDPCSNSPCLNSGVCTGLCSSVFTCDCTGTGFTDATCSSDVDDCASAPCLNGGNCTDAGANAFSCDCTGTGFTNSTCTVDVDDCASAPCLNTGVCTDAGTNAFACDCTGTGFTDAICSSDVDDCASAPCVNGGNCTDFGTNAFSCNCSTGFTGATCSGDIDDCASAPCLNTGVCTDAGANAFACDCTGTGFSDAICSSDVDDCASAPCLNGGNCTDAGANAYSCACSGTGFTNSACDVEIDECASTPCGNGGSCTDMLLDFTCTCSQGWTGENCLTDIDDCMSNPCDMCADPSANVCLDEGTNSYSCACTCGTEDVIFPTVSGNDSYAASSFGEAIAMDGTTAIVGAPFDSVVSYFDGSAYIFSEVSDGNSSSWSEVQKLTGSGNDYAYFGAAVAIEGSMIAVGSRRDNNPAANTSGIVYLYTQVSPSSWDFVDQIYPSNSTERQSFGCSIVIRDSQILVGANFDLEEGGNSGTAYIYKENSPGNWTEAAQIYKGVYRFASSLDKTNDTIMIGQSSSSSHTNVSVYIEVAENDWQETQVLQGDAGYGSAVGGFGSAILMQDGMAIISAEDGDIMEPDLMYTSQYNVLHDGAGLVFVFVEVTLGTWAQTMFLTRNDAAAYDSFGVSLGYSSSSGTLAVGASSANAYSGIVVLFNETAPGIFEHMTDLAANDPMVNTYFGEAIALSDYTLMAGAPSLQAPDGSRTTVGGLYVISPLCDIDPDECASSPCLNGGLCSSGNIGLFDRSFSCNCTYPFAGTTCDVSACPPGSQCTTNSTVACDPGTFNDGTYETCAACSVGKYVPFSGSLACIDCPFGAYAASESSVACDSCPAGSYNNITAATTCTSCASGTYQNSTGQSTCFDCAAGMQCTTDSTSPCDPGTFNDGTSETCTACSPGTYASFYGSLACIDCPFGAYAASESSVTCNSCPAGSYNNIIGATTCTSCASGTYQNSTSQTVCVDCAVGFYTVEDGTSDPLDCLDIDDCPDVPCSGNGICQDLTGGYVCNCDTGYTGPNCTIDIDDCDSAPCANGGTCDDLVDAYICTCGDAYFGLQCETNIDACAAAGDPCVNGECFSSEDGSSYVCVCSAGYTGTLCDTDEDNCALSPCKHEGVCTDLLDDFSCACTTGFTGSTCATEVDECDSSPCMNGTCVDLIGGFSCTCDAGFTGLLCDTDIDDCAVEPCEHGGTCTDQVNGYSCACADGYTGAACVSEIDECASAPCFNDATCIDELLDFTCACKPGFTGELCETDVDNCATISCANGGTCIDGVNAFSCVCATGFEGTTCTININDCLYQPCQNDGICVDGIASYVCDCAAGWTGSLCADDVDECASSPCNQGNCTNLRNAFDCSCDDGYGGVLCDVNIDECADTGVCANGATCIDGVNEYSCSCASGFTDAKCETNIDDCASNPCDNGATCIDGVDTYSCECPNGYTGSICEENIDDCVSIVCESGGTCVDGVNNYLCSCSEGTYGRHCELTTDNCLADPCSNGATCVSAVGTSFDCLCATGYTGDLCDADIDECASTPCANGGICSEPSIAVGLFECDCMEGYSGSSCTVFTAAPMISSMRVGDTYKTISISFDSATNKPSSADCTGLLTAAFIATIRGTGPALTCSWTTATLLRVSWENALTNTLQVGTSYIALLPDAVKSSDTLSAFVTPVAVLLAAPVTVPTVSLRLAANMVSACAEIKLDASGSTGGAGRALALQWSAVVDTQSGLSSTDYTKLNEHLEYYNVLLKTPNAVTMRIPDGLTPPGVDYRFMLHATSWLGESDMADFNLTKPAMEAPSITSTPSNAADYFERVRGDIFEIEMRGVLESCEGATTMSYLWKQTGGPTDYYLPRNVRESSTLYLPANVLMPGSFYTYEVNVTSTDNRGESQHAVEEVRLYITAIAAPVATSVELVFDEYGSKGMIYVNFDVDTNRARMYSGSSCSEVLAGSTLALFSGDTECVWSSNKRLKLTWAEQSTSLLSIGSEIRLLGGIIRTEDQLSVYSNIQSLFIGAPSNSWPIQAVISGPLTLGLCSDLTLDAGFSTGSGGKAFSSYAWELVRNDDVLAMSSTDYLELRGAIESQTRSSLSLDRDIVPIDFELQVTVTVTNWLGMSATSEEPHTVVKSVDQYPTATLVDTGKLIALDRYTELPFSIEAVRGGSGCSSVTETLSAEWTFTSGPTFTGTINTDSNILNLPTDSLLPGSTYVFTYTVTIEETGAETAVDVTIITLEAPVPAVSLAQWDSSLGYFMVYFDRDTDRNGDTRGREVDCDELLRDITLDALGQRPRCQWRSASELKVSVGSKSVQSSTLQVVFLNDTVRSADGLSKAITTTDYDLINNAEDYYIALPERSVQVQAKIQSPEQVGSCESITLDGGTSKGSAGRWSSFSWEIVVSSYWTQLSENEYDNINANLSLLNTLVIEVPNELLPEGRTYVFKLTLVNWLGGTAYVERRVFKSSLGLPLLALSDLPARSSRVDDPFLAIATYEPSSCEEMTLGFLWELVSTDDELFDSSVFNQTSEMSQLYVPASTMRAQKEYEYRLTTYVQDTPALYNVANVKVTIESSDLVPVASLSSGRVPILNNTNLTLSGSDSYDPDDLANANGPLAISWSCETQSSSGPCFSAAIEDELLTGRADLDLPTTLFYLNETFIFTLTISKDERTESETLSFEFVESLVPQASISLSIRNITQERLTKVTASERFVLQAMTVADAFFDAGEYTFLWTSSDVNLSRSDVVKTSVDNPTLVIAPNALEAGQRAEFRVRVYSSVVSEQLYGEAVVVVEANSAPQSGTCEVSPTSGDIFTKFTLTCSDWLDDLEDFPLSYGFSARKAGTSEAWAEVPNVGEWQGARILSDTILPVGRDGDYKVEVRAQIRDRLGATAEYIISNDVNFTVSWPAEAPVVTDFNTMLDEALESGSVNLMQQAIFAAYGLLNNATIGGNVTEEVLKAQRYRLLEALVQYNRDQPFTTDGFNRQIEMAYGLCNLPVENYWQVSNMSVLCATYMEEVFRNATITEQMSSLALITTIALKAGSQNATMTNTTEEAALISIVYDLVREMGISLTAVAVDGEEPVVVNGSSMEVTSRRISSSGMSNTTQSMSNNMSIVFPSGMGSMDGVEWPDTLRVVTVHNFMTDFYQNMDTSPSGNYSVGNDTVIDYHGNVPSISLELFDDNGNAIAVHGLRDEDAFIFSFPIDDMNAELEALLYAENSTMEFSWLCQYWDTTISAWSSDGCNQLLMGPVNETGFNSTDGYSVYCACTHLTEFGVGQQGVEKPQGNVEDAFVDLNINTIDEDKIKDAFSWKAVRDHPIPLITTLSLFAVYFILLAFMYRKDKRDYNKRLHNSKELFLKYQRLLDNLELTSFEKFFGGMFHFLRNQHKWFSICFYDSDDAIEGNYTGKERATVLTCSMLAGMVCAALFYGEEQSNDFSQIIVVSITALLMITFNFVMAQFFRRAMPADLAKHLNDAILEDHSVMILKVRKLREQNVIALLKSNTDKQNDSKEDKKHNAVRSRLLRIARTQIKEQNPDVKEHTVTIHPEMTSVVQLGEFEAASNQKMDAKSVEQSALLIQATYRGHLARRKVQMINTANKLLCKRIIGRLSAIDSLVATFDLDNDHEPDIERYAYDVLQRMNESQLNAILSKYDAALATLHEFLEPQISGHLPAALERIREALATLENEHSDTVYDFESMKKVIPEDTWHSTRGFEDLLDFAEKMEVRIEIVHLMRKRMLILERYYKRMGYDAKTNRAEDMTVAAQCEVHIGRLDNKLMTVIEDYENEFGVKFFWPTLEDDILTQLFSDAKQLEELVHPELKGAKDAPLAAPPQPSDDAQLIDIKTFKSDSAAFVEAPKDPKVLSPKSKFSFNFNALNEDARLKQTNGLGASTFAKVKVMKNFDAAEQFEEVQPVLIRPIHPMFRTFAYVLCVAWMITSFFLILVYASYFSRQDGGKDADAIALLWLVDLTYSSLFDTLLVTPMLNAGVVALAVILRSEFVKVCASATPCCKHCLKMFHCLKVPTSH